jgi:hypothetical protein
VGYLVDSRCRRGMHALCAPSILSGIRACGQAKSGLRVRDVRARAGAVLRLGSVGRDDLDGRHVSRHHVVTFLAASHFCGIKIQ